MVRPPANASAHQFPDTTWFTSSRTVQPSQTDGLDHWLSPTPATKTRVASSDRACTSGRSTSTGVLLVVRYANSRPGGGGTPGQQRPSMKIHERRWIALGP